MRTLSERAVEVCLDDSLARISSLPETADAVIAIGDLEQLARFTKALGTTRSRTPAVLVTREGSLGDLVAMIRGPVYGMVTFHEGLTALVDMVKAVEQDIQLRDLRMSSADAARRGLAHLRRAGASGLLHVEAEEGGGQVLLREGRVIDAECGALRGEDAAAALVAGLRGDVSLRWSTLDNPHAATVVAPAQPDSATEIFSISGAALTEIPASAKDVLAPLRVVFADDDEALRTLFQKTLEHHGFVVTAAVDGRDALGHILRDRPDLILSDIMMPRLDGWGLLAAIRTDHRLRETPFALLSCHHDFLDQLSALGAGADAYLPKGVRREQVVEVLTELARPLQILRACIGPGVSLRGHFGRLGPQTMMRVLAARNATGKLTVEDRWARFHLWFSAGILASASAVIGSTCIADEEALRSLVGAQGGCWVFEADEEPELWSMRRPAVEVIDEIARRATHEEASVRDNLVTGTQALVPNEAVLRFYEKVCPDALQPALAQVRAGRPPREILAEGVVSPLLIDWLFKDMLSKGAVHFTETI
ncbi:MAG: response regulator [Pseudomonadota bacterium]